MLAERVARELRGRLAFSYAGHDNLGSRYAYAAAAGYAQSRRRFRRSTIGRQYSISDFQNLSSSSAVEATGIAPSCRMRCVMPGSFTALIDSCSSLRTTSRGVPARVKNENQLAFLKVGNPTSESGGTSGRIV